MHRLYSETLRFQLDRQHELVGQQRRERLTLSDGRRFEISRWFARAGEWLVDRLAELGRHLPCLEDELACEPGFSA